jgi:hypothetical protein
MQPKKVESKRSESSSPAKAFKPSVSAAAPISKKPTIKKKKEAPAKKDIFPEVFQNHSMGVSVKDQEKQLEFSRFLEVV